MKRATIAAALLAASLAAATGAAFAGTDDAGQEAADAKALLAAKVTAIKAAETAESSLGGKTSSVSFEMKDGQGLYHVEVVMADGTQEDVAVDATSGAMSKLSADQVRQDAPDGQLGEGEDGDSDGDGVADQ